MVLSNHSVVFVYMISPRSFAITSRPYNYGICGVLGRRTWKAYLECLYCKVKAWIHEGKQHTNMIKRASVWIWVEGWLLKDSLSKSRWLRSWAIFEAHPLFLFFAWHFFHHLFWLSFQLSLSLSLSLITYSPCLFFRLVWRMERDLGYMESLFCGEVEKHVCGEVKSHIYASSQCKSIAKRGKHVFAYSQCKSKAYMVECMWSWSCKHGASLTRVTWFDKTQKI
jgi:hypothetical protein